MKTNTNNSPVLASLAKLAPSIAVSVQWERDDTFKWDGDGPNPKKQGFFPHDVSVRVSIVGCGRLVHGFDYLGGCYCKPSRMDDSDHDVHGYLPQMVLAALEDLPTLKVGCNDCVVEMAEHIIHVNDQIQDAMAWLRAEMTRRWEAQQKGGK